MSDLITVMTAASLPDAPPLPFVISNSPTSATVRWEVCPSVVMVYDVMTLSP